MNKQNNAKKEYLFVLLIALVVMSLSIDYLVVSYDQTNVSSRVNVTSAGPEIIAMNFHGGSITLTEGTTTVVDCNITVRDYKFVYVF